MELLLVDREPHKPLFLSTGNILTLIYPFLRQKQTLQPYF